MKQFYDALRESIITQAVTTVLVVGTTMYLVASGQNVPDWLLQMTLLIIGFYFGSKAGYNAGKNFLMPFVNKRRQDKTLKG